MTWTPERHARNRALLAALPDRPWYPVNDFSLYWTLANCDHERLPVWADLLSAETDASEAVAQFCADAPGELQAAMDEIERVQAELAEARARRDQAVALAREFVAERCGPVLDTRGTEIGVFCSECKRGVTNGPHYPHCRVPRWQAILDAIADPHETYIPGSDGPDPTPDEYEPAGHEPPDAPRARPGAMREWIEKI